MIEKCLMYFGLICAIAIIMLIIAMIKEFVTEGINHAKHIYRRKHRFDKPPTAKCYCIDCVYYIMETKQCSRREVLTYHPDNYFCADAEGKTR